MADVIMKHLGGGMAASLLALALLETLMAKGVLSLAEVRSTLQNARGGLGQEPEGPLNIEAASILEWLLTMRFPDNSVRE
jgi:hypothetical protein